MQPVSAVSNPRRTAIAPCVGRLSIMRRIVRLRTSEHKSGSMLLPMETIKSSGIIARVVPIPTLKTSEHNH